MKYKILKYYEVVKSKFLAILKLEKKHKIISYLSLLILFYTTNNLRIDNEKLKKSDLESRAEVKFLKANLISYNRVLDEFTVALWQKKKIKNMYVGQYFNNAYIDFFGNSFGYNVYNVIGKNNFQLGYPKEVASRYYKNDSIVAYTGKELRIIEKYVDKQGKRKKINVLKWRVIKEKDTLIYGMVYDFIDE